MFDFIRKHNIKDKALDITIFVITKTRNNLLCRNTTSENINYPH